MSLLLPPDIHAQRSSGVVAGIGTRRQQCGSSVLHLFEADPQNRKNLLETALEAGFGSYAQFYRVFCETTDCPPAAYLQK